jgi:hypothetical protein
VKGVLQATTDSDEIKFRLAEIFGKVVYKL